MKKYYTQSLIILGSLLLLVGGILGSFSLLAKSQSVLTVSPPKNGITAEVVSKDLMPTRVVVPSVDISLGVIPGYYDKTTQQWTANDKNAVYATPTVPPNTKIGNTLIYAHNRKNLFGPLLNTKTGDEAMVVTKGGKTYRYSLQQAFDVNPEDTSVFKHTKSPTLVLQTCSGLFLQHRRMFVFKLEKAA